MYRVLIVDDEKLVRNGIKSSINWNQLNIEMIAEAENGIEAMEQFLQSVPDIILLDIRMPRMDGLEFANIIKKKFPHVRIIILTGINDFENVRAALRIGVDDYILKPIAKEKIKEAICRQLAKISEEQKHGNKEPAKSSKVITKADVLNAMLENGTVSREDIDEFCILQKCEPSQECYFVYFCDNYKSFRDWNTGDSLDLLEFSILNIADEILVREGKGCAFKTYKGEIALLLVCNFDEVTGTITEILTHIEDFLEAKLSVAISTGGEIKQIPILRKQAIEAAELVFVSDNPNIIFYQDAIKRQSINFEYPMEIERELVAKIFSEPVEDCKDLIEKFFARMENSALDAQSCKYVLLRLLTKLSNSIDIFNNISIIEMPYEVFDPIRVVEKFKTLREAKDWIKKLFEDSHIYIHKANNSRDHLFKKIIDYIHANYMDSELNLKKCSTDLYLSYSYITRILKKRTQKCFVDYLNEYRILKAVEMLANPGSLISEVSEKVGFTHTTYFSVVFKKIMGVPPKQFRSSEGCISMGRKV